MKTRTRFCRNPRCEQTIAPYLFVPICAPCRVAVILGGLVAGLVGFLGALMSIEVWQ